MEYIPVILVCILMLALLIGYLWIVAWAIGDAQRRGHSGGVIVPLFWLFGPLAALVWLIARPKQTLVQRTPDYYDDPGDAIAAASRLDSLGDWDAAIALYRTAAERWPEHSDYIGNCIEAIMQKQATANA